MSLPTINEAKTRGFWKEVRATTQVFETYAAGAIAQVFQGEYEYRFDTAFNQKAHMDKAYFMGTDSLAAGDAQTVPSVTCAAARPWNHMACWFNQIQVDIQGTNVENIIDIAEVDSYAKRAKYNEDYFNRVGECMNLKVDITSLNANDGFAKRVTRDRAANATQSYLWHPDCCSVFDKVLTQNLNISVKVRISPDIRTRAVQSSAAADANTASIGTGANNYRYCVSNLVLYVWITEEDIAPSNKDVPFDLRPIYPARVTWNLTSTSGTLNYQGIPATTYQIGLGLCAGDRNTNILYSPTDFKTANNKQQLTTYRLKYANYDYPQYQITETQTSHRFRSFLQSMSDLEKNDIGDSGESYTFYVDRGEIYHFDIVKREDDRSTTAELQLTAPANFTGEDVFLFCKYVKDLVITYNELGNPIAVTAQIPS